MQRVELIFVDLDFTSATPDWGSMSPEERDTCASALGYVQGFLDNPHVETYIDVANEPENFDCTPKDFVRHCDLIREATGRLGTRPSGLLPGNISPRIMSAYETAYGITRNA